MATPAQSQPDPSRVAADVLSLRRALSPDIRDYQSGGHHGPYLVILSGLPGTGKSYFANCLNGRLSFLTVGSDRMRKTLVPEPKYKRSEHIRVFAACHRLIEELLGEGYRVIFDRGIPPSRLRVIRPRRFSLLRRRLHRSRRPGTREVAPPQRRPVPG